MDEKIILNNNIMTVRTLVNEFYDLVESELEDISSGDITPHNFDNYTTQIVSICETIKCIYERGCFSCMNI